MLLSCSSNLRGRGLACVDPVEECTKTVRTVGVCLLVAKTIIPEDLRPQIVLDPHNSKSCFPRQCLFNDNPSGTY